MVDEIESLLTSAAVDAAASKAAKHYRWARALSLLLRLLFLAAVVAAVVATFVHYWRDAGAP
jgi:hypothetical protein